MPTPLTLESIRQRDATAVAELVRIHHASLRGFVAYLSADTDAVDDLSQEVFLRALRRIEVIDDLDDVGRYLRGIARNVVREHCRAKQRESSRYQRFVDQEPLAGASNDPDEDRASMAKALRHCLQQAPERSRQLLAMRYEQDLSARDIGATLGSSEGAVRVALLRVRERLLDCLRLRGFLAAGESNS